MRLVATDDGDVSRLKMALASLGAALQACVMKLAVTLVVPLLFFGRNLAAGNSSQESFMNFVNINSDG